MRVGIIVGFVAVMVSLIVIVLAGIVMMSKPSGEQRTAAQLAEDVRRAHGNFDPDVNPFLLKTPNVLGLKPAGSVVVVLDTSSQGRRWLSMAGDALIAGLPGSAGPAYQVIFAKDGSTQAVPEALANLSESTQQTLKDELFNARPFGQASLSQAMASAAAAKPAQVILITSQDMTTALADALSAEMAKAPATSRLDVIHLGEQPGPLGQTAEKHKGILVNLPVTRLAQWHQDWQASQGQ